jgi:hypothetical protein
LDGIFILTMRKSIVEADVNIFASANLFFFFHSSGADRRTRCTEGGVDSLAHVLYVPALLKDVRSPFDSFQFFLVVGEISVAMIINYIFFRMMWLLLFLSPQSIPWLGNRFAHILHE